MLNDGIEEHKDMSDQQQQTNFFFDDALLVSSDQGTSLSFPTGTATGKLNKTADTRSSESIRLVKLNEKIISKEMKSLK